MVTLDPDQPLILISQDMHLPKGKRFWVDYEDLEYDDDGLPTHRFTVQEVAVCFFARSPSWLRGLLRPDAKNTPANGGWFSFDGVAMEFARLSSGMRVFSLADIERMAHALAEHGKIDGESLGQIVTIVKMNARLRGIEGV